MANPYPNVGSQIERALRQYFISGYLGTTAVPNPQLSNGGIFVTLDSGTRKNPLRTIMAHQSREGIELIGQEVYSVTIMDQFDAVFQPGQSDAAYNQVQIDLQVGNMQFLMMLTSDQANLDQTVRNITDAGRSLAVLESNGGSAKTPRDAIDNADMAFFTCLFVVPKGSKRGFAADEGESTEKMFWREVRQFEITAINSAVDGYSNAGLPPPLPLAVENGQMFPIVADSGNTIWEGTDIGTGLPVYVFVQNEQIKVSNQPPA